MQSNNNQPGTQRRRSARLAARSSTDATLPPQIPNTNESPNASEANTEQNISVPPNTVLPLRRELPPIPDTDEHKENTEINVDDTDNESATNPPPQQRNRGQALGPNFLTNPKQYGNAMKNFKTRWFTKVMYFIDVFFTC